MSAAPSTQTGRQPLALNLGLTPLTFYLQVGRVERAVLIAAQLVALSLIALFWAVIPL
ncbi:hypothetical protein [Pseudomonas benzenivorans]|uniref:Uncharacterized protein n=1 Tax=Pseudomonas benzenivorans TaxID=556533 RepID=A0ABY5H487_9PSED|nr:hypothetical protein KDW96_16885 [Pseudomonas benzenivorans]